MAPCVATDMLRGFRAWDRAPHGFGVVPQGAVEPVPPCKGRAAGKTIHRAWRKKVGPVAAVSRKVIEPAPDRCSCAAA